MNRSIIFCFVACLGIGVHGFAKSDGTIIPGKHAWPGKVLQVNGKEWQKTKPYGYLPDIVTATNPLFAKYPKNFEVTQSSGDLEAKQAAQLERNRKAGFIGYLKTTAPLNHKASYDQMLAWKETFRREGGFAKTCQYAFLQLKKDLHQLETTLVLEKDLRDLRLELAGKTKNFDERCLPTFIKLTTKEGACTMSAYKVSFDKKRLKHYMSFLKRVNGQIDAHNKRAQKKRLKKTNPAKKTNRKEAVREKSLSLAEMRSRVESVLEP